MAVIARLAKALQVMIVLYTGITRGQKSMLTKGEGNNYVLKPVGINEMGPGVIDIKSLPPIPITAIANDAPVTNSQSTLPLDPVCISFIAEKRIIKTEQAPAIDKA